MPQQLPGLAPVHPPLGINAAFCAPKQTTLTMKEKVWSLSGDSFHVMDENNIEVVRCQGKTFSFSDRKEFMDPQGRPLFALRNKHLVLHKTFYGEAPDGKELFRVKSQFSCKLYLVLLACQIRSLIDSSWKSENERHVYEFSLR